MRRALLAALLLLAPAAAAQGGGDAKTFALVGIARSGNAVELTLTNVAGGTGALVAALLDRDVLLAPEQTLSAWPYGQTRTLRFDLGASPPAQATLRVTGDGVDDALSFHVPARPEDAGGARVEVVDVAPLDPARVRFTLRSTGAREAGPIVVAIEDEKGARISEPLTRTVGPLAPGAEATADFALPQDAQSARVVLAYQNETMTATVRIPPRGAWVEVAAATLGGDGNATFTLKAPTPVGPVDVSVESLAGVNVGSPLARRIDVVGPGGASVTFALPEGTTEAKLVVRGPGRTESFALRLADADGNGTRWTLRTDLPSREAQPGGSVGYQLTLENGGPEALATLRAEGLPEGYEVEFSVDGSVVPEVLVPKGASRRVTATVAVPESAARDAGGMLPFSVLVGDGEARIDLSLAVRGRGRLELQGQNWFANAAPGAPATVTVTLRNAGSAALSGVTLESSAPPGWSVTFDPARIERLEAGESRAVEVTVDPAEDAGAGRYLIDVSAATDDASARPRSLSVEVRADESSRLPWVLGAGLAALLGVALIVKLRRR